MVRSYSSKGLGNGVKVKGLDQMKNNSNYRGPRPFACTGYRLSNFKMIAEIREVIVYCKEHVTEFLR